MDHEHGQGEQPQEQLTWTELIPDEQWVVYRRVIHEAHAQGLRFAVGGAMALATYTGRWRNTKDLDLYIVPSDRDDMVGAVTRAGLSDYHDQLPYDRDWIYRAHEGDIIVDLIWQMANQRAAVDEAWLTRGPAVNLRGELLRIIPPEEMIWNKIYILQRERCDWPDVLNLIYTRGATLDWDRLLAHVAGDAPLLRGVVSIFTWLCPGRAQALPPWLWERLHLPEPPTDVVPEIDLNHMNLIDSRSWFGSAQSIGESG